MGPYGNFLFSFKTSCQLSSRVTGVPAPFLVLIGTSNPVSPCSHLHLVSILSLFSHFFRCAVMASWDFDLHFPDLDYTDNLDKYSARKWAKDMKDFSLKRIYRWKF